MGRQQTRNALRRRWCGRSGQPPQGAIPSTFRTGLLHPRRRSLPTRQPVGVGFRHLLSLGMPRRALGNGNLWLCLGVPLLSKSNSLLSKQRISVDFLLFLCFLGAVLFLYFLGALAGDLYYYMH